MRRIDTHRSAWSCLLVRTTSWWSPTTAESGDTVRCRPSGSASPVKAEMRHRIFPCPHGRHANLVRSDDPGPLYRWNLIYLSRWHHSPFGYRLEWEDFDTTASVATVLTGFRHTRTPRTCDSRSGSKQSITFDSGHLDDSRIDIPSHAAIRAIQMTRGC